MKKFISILLAFVLVISSIPARASDKETRIIGPATTTVEQMKAWAIANEANKEFIEQAENFYKISVKYGIDPAVTYAQSAKETNFFKFTGVVTLDFKNPCGLKVTEGGGNYEKSAHKKFASWEEGITAQVHHLALYAGQKGFPMAKDKTPDPRHFESILGKAKTVEALGTNWAPAKLYGWELACMMYNLTTATVKGQDPIKGAAGQKEIPKELLHIDDELNKELAKEKEETLKKDAAKSLVLNLSQIKPKDKMSRIFGANRIITAANISKNLTDKSESVIIASSDNFTDALLASVLQVKFKNPAPVLLNSGGVLNSAVKDELIRLGARRVYLVGGEKNMPESLVKEVGKIIGSSPILLRGSSRYDTAVQMAKLAGVSDTYILVNGEVFADALSISKYSGENGYPILLTNGNNLDNATLSLLKSGKKVIIVGGEKSVSRGIESKLKELGKDVLRVAGGNRYETAAEVHWTFNPGAEVFLVADGAKFPDSLVGSPLALKYGASILLTNSNSLSGEVREVIKAAKSASIVCLGGNNSVSQEVYLNLYSLAR